MKKTVVQLVDLLGAGFFGNAAVRASGGAESVSGGGGGRRRAAAAKRGSLGRQRRSIARSARRKHKHNGLAVHVHA